MIEVYFYNIYHQKTYKTHLSGPLVERVPQLDFAPNTSLEDVYLFLQLPLSLRIIERTLVSTISSITSPHLYHLVIGAGTSEGHQPFDVGDVSQYRGSKAVDGFHTILNALRFDDLPSDGVEIHIRDPRPGHTHRLAMIEFIVLVKFRLDELFAPWFARKVLKVSYDHGLGGTPRLRERCAQFIPCS